MRIMLGLGGVFIVLIIYILYQIINSIYYMYYKHSSQACYCGRINAWQKERHWRPGWDSSFFQLDAL